MNTLLITSCLLAATVLPFAVYGQDPAASPSPTPTVVLDENRWQKSEATIRRAGQQGDVGTLLLAFRKEIDLGLCLEQLYLLPRDKKRQMILGMLGDEKILPPAQFENIHPRRTTWQSTRPREVEIMSYEILGEQPPKYHGMLTRKQMDALAVRLRAVQ